MIALEKVSKCRHDCTQSIYLPFFVHRVIPIGSNPIVESGQITRRRVSPTNSPAVAWLALDNSSYESPRDARVVAVVLRIGSREQTIFEISHNPRALAGASAPVSFLAEVNGFHMACTSILVGGLGVAVVEAAAMVCQSGCKLSRN
jgi:hypothetical protein